MAINRKPYKFDPATQTWSNEDSPVTSEYVGQVFSVFNDDYRAMSDVYTTATFAQIIQDDGSPRVVLVNANFECDMSGGWAEVDVNEKYLTLFKAYEVRQDEIAKEHAAKHAAEAAEKELNAPRVGKRMVVKSGRKVPVGTVGTVAYISGSGGVLLKDDASWQDRNANGTWVAACHLAARTV